MHTGPSSGYLVMTFNKKADMKNGWVQIRTSEEEKKLIKKAAQTLSKASGKKENISRTILVAVEGMLTKELRNESRA